MVDYINSANREEAFKVVFDGFGKIWVHAVGGFMAW